jgi:hypothetical protein
MEPGSARLFLFSGPVHIRPPRFAFVCAVAVLVVGCSERFDWREVRSPDGYAISLPGRPQTATREIDVEGHRLRVSMTSTGIGQALFAVGVAQLPAELAADAAKRERTVAYFRDSLVRNIHGTVSAAGPARLVLAPGVRQVVLASQEVQAIGVSGGRPAVLAARFFIIDDRLYQVIALGGDGGIPAQALDTFFTSFRPQT